MYVALRITSNDAILIVRWRFSSVVSDFQYVHPSRIHYWSSGVDELPCVFVPAHFKHWVIVLYDWLNGIRDERVSSKGYAWDRGDCLIALWVQGVVELEVQLMQILPSWWSIGNGWCRLDLIRFDHRTYWVRIVRNEMGGKAIENYVSALEVAAKALIDLD